MYEKCFERSSNLTDTVKIARGFTTFADRKKKIHWQRFPSGHKNFEPILNSFDSYGFIKEKKEDWNTGFQEMKNHETKSMILSITIGIH